MFACMLGYRCMAFKTSGREELRQSEERFRLLVESVRDYAIFMLDPDGHVLTWNAGAERFKGYRADEIIGQHFSRFYPPEALAARTARARTRGREKTKAYSKTKVGASGKTARSSGRTWSSRPCEMPRVSF